MYYNNPFTPPFYQSNNPRPIEIPHVNGIEGAKAYQYLPSNSSILLLDENAPVVYLVRTDSACFKTITPYTITEQVPEPPLDVRSLSDRINAIERRLDEQSNIKPVKPDEPEARTDGSAYGNTKKLWQSDRSDAGDAR